MSLKLVIQLIGGLAVFLYGMKLTSESLQRVAGEGLKNLLERITTNRFSAAISGTAITCIIQSSSATTVMVVSFVNAALLNLRQAIGVIMGANIGTTLTAWIVAFLGFKFKIGFFAFPAVALGVIMLFTNRDRLVGWGSVFIGFGLLFLGLGFLKDAVPDAAKNPETFAFIQSYVSDGYGGLLLFVLFGTLLTVIVQSSSATTAITITLAVKGYIDGNLAMAMILGENIGTTITANLAALAGNINAKKAALAHTVFNLFGVAWVLVVFYFIANTLMPMLVPGDPTKDKTLLGFYISVFHSGFNITNTLLLIWFVPQIERMVSGVVDRISGKERLDERLTLLSSGSVSSAGLSLLEAAEHQKAIMRNSLGNFKSVENLLLKGFDEDAAKKLFEMEQELDDHRHEMLTYVGQLQAGGVSGESGRELLVLAERVRILEELADVFARIGRRLSRAQAKKGLRFPRADHKTMLEDHFKILNNHLALINAGLNAGTVGDEASREQSERFREQMRNRQIKSEKAIQKERLSSKHKLPEVLLMAGILNNLDTISHYMDELIKAGKA